MHDRIRRSRAAVQPANMRQEAAGRSHHPLEAELRMPMILPFIAPPRSLPVSVRPTQIQPGIQLCTSQNSYGTFIPVHTG